MISNFVFIFVIIFIQNIVMVVSKQPPKCVIGQPYASPVPDIPNNAAMLKIKGPQGWIPNDVSRLKLSFAPPLTQGVDYSIWSDPNQYILPDHFQERNVTSIIYLKLAPGQRWAKVPSTDLPVQLVLQSVLCPHTSKGNVTLFKKLFAPTVVANIVEDMITCPESMTLPGASAELQRKIYSILRDCQAPTIINSCDLNWKHYDSLSLLTIQPPLIIVDGSQQELFVAGKKVDDFLAPHSVLDVAWEPISEDEPRYWILVPRPLGMPGHMFAMLDHLQWHHPLVTGHNSIVNRGRPSCEKNDCTHGCERTQLAGITGSGYSADAFNSYNVLREGFMRNIPIQVFPSTLGARSIPPCKFPTFCFLAILIV